jgi:hypothetical protein
MDEPEYKYAEWTDKELLRAWNHLETCRLTPYVERKMDEIEQEICYRQRKAEQQCQ